MLKIRKEAVRGLYNNLLSVIESYTGDDTTNSGLLDQIGRSLFLSKWKGVFASDESYPAAGYCIVNLDISSMNGSHWVAVANGLVYDSFGRCGLLNKKTLKCGGDSVPDQRITETNCGQRCLAWLCVYQVMGADGANMI